MDYLEKALECLGRGDTVGYNFWMEKAEEE